MTKDRSGPTNTTRLYDEDGDALLSVEAFPERVSLVPGEPARPEGGRRLRILWGQEMLSDLIDGRYRAVVCGVNDTDNSKGIISQLVGLIGASQWTEASVTSYARMFQESVALHAAHDREPYVLKYDLDSLLILGLLRPRGKDAFSLQDLSRGFRTISRMLAGRAERLPIASVSFLGARSNRLVGDDGREPSFETVLRTMHQAGFRGDVYPNRQMWDRATVGVFPSYPFPGGVERMRQGSS